MSSSPPAVACEAIGKRYRTLRGPRGVYKYGTLRDALAGSLRRLGLGGRPQPGAAAEPFWALRDVSFAVDPGQVVGIMGPNGSGKTTLLKILSRVTKPTAGRARLYGRVGTLLEVGAGFHPELTGRENIWLSGAVLGMRRREIAAKFDAIVEFAEIASFLDTPVKRYSSGMYVRLAFAVAAHLEPDILLVDEVLAVGDIAFQRKCLGRMQDVGRGGCTVLFVSHQIPAVESLCTRAMLFDAGRLVQDGDVAGVVREYQRRAFRGPGEDQGIRTDLGTLHRPAPVFRSVALLDDLGRPTAHVPLGGPFHVRIALDAGERLRYPTVTIGLDDPLGYRLLTLRTRRVDPVCESVERGVLECRVDAFPLGPGDYWLTLGLTLFGRPIDELDRVLRFTVVDSEGTGLGPGGPRGVCVAPATWAMVDGLVPKTG